MGMWNDLLLDVGGSIVFGSIFFFSHLSSVLVFLIITVSCRVFFFFSCINCHFLKFFPPLLQSVAERHFHSTRSPASPK